MEGDEPNGLVRCPVDRGARRRGSTLSDGTDGNDGPAPSCPAGAFVPTAKRSSGRLTPSWPSCSRRAAISLRSATMDSVVSARTLARRSFSTTSSCSRRAEISRSSCSSYTVCRSRTRAASAAACRRYRATRKAPMNAAHSAARVPTRIHTALSETTIITVAMTASTSSTMRAMFAGLRSSLRGGRADRGLSIAPSELMPGMIPTRTVATAVTTGVSAWRGCTRRWIRSTG